MLQLKPLARNVSLFQQFQTGVSPVVLVNIFDDAQKDIPERITVWESLAHFRATFNHPDFKQALAHYPSSAVASSHQFTRLAVPNICVYP
jgi:hypothetical protein